MKILCFGDSITAGQGEVPMLGWVGRIKLGSAFNLGAGGDTSAELLERIKSQKDAFLKNDQGTIIIAIGMNDSCISSGIDEKQFRKNLQEIINKIKSDEVKIIFVGLTPVVEELAKEYGYENKIIKKYNAIIKTICKKNEIQFIDIFSKFSKEDYGIMLQDGLHPNSKGYDFMSRIIKESIKL